MHSVFALHLRGLARVVPLLVVFGGAPLPALAADLLATETKRYSHGNEDLIIRDFFQDRRGGFFLDVGAAWPIRNNNTYYLEKHLGWRGIAVDALPDYGPMWAKQRSGTPFLNFIVTDHSGGVETFYRAGWAGLSSLKKERVMQGQPVHQQEIKVPTITLNDLLERNGVERIDLLSMDIEEAEPLALAGLAIEKYRPALVCIEATLAVRERLLAYFGAHGYERLEKYLAHDPTNWYFAPKAAADAP
jgi:FkbM family methyltransferase